MDNYTDPSALFDQHAYGQTAEQQLAELQTPLDVDGLKHQAVLLDMAHRGRLAQDEILRRHSAGEFDDPQHVLQASQIQQRAQEEQDRNIVNGLSTGTLVISSPEDEQRLQDNANARAKFRSSPYIDDADREQLIAQTYADDAVIRRSAVPIPPEQRGRSWDTRLDRIYSQMSPETSERLRGLIVPGAKGEPQIMRGLPSGILDDDQDQDPDLPPMADQPLPTGDQDAIQLFDVAPEKVPDATTPGTTPTTTPTSPPKKPRTPQQEAKRKAIMNPKYCDPDLASWAIDNGYESALRWNGSRDKGHIPNYELDKSVLAALKEHYAEQHPKETAEEKAQHKAESSRDMGQPENYGRVYHSVLQDLIRTKKATRNPDDDSPIVISPEEVEAEMERQGWDLSPRRKSKEQSKAAPEGKSIAPEGKPQGQPKRIRSPSGKFEWDGKQWVPVEGK